MISLKTNSAIDKTKWDDCIHASADNSIFVQSWYLDIVDPDWSALVLNDYDAVFPLSGRSKYGISYLYQPFFSRYFGVYKKEGINVTEEDFFNSIPDNFKHIEFSLHENSAFSNANYQLKERQFQELDLKANYLKIKEGYSDNTKRNIKKAEKAGFRVSKSVSPEEIVELFRKTKGGELDIFRAGDYTKLVNLMNKCRNLNSAESIAVYDQDNNLHAAVFFMKHQNRYIFLKSGVTEHGKTHGAMHFLIDLFIKEHAEQGYVLDFGGSSVESVARFYKSFGAKDCVYLQVKRNRLPRLLNWIKSLKS
jgi:hypothetical protein